MGMSKLVEIQQIFIELGKEEVPVAIIQQISTEKERIAVGQIGELVLLAASNELSNPAVIVIGEVVHALKNGFGQEVRNHFSMSQKVA